MYILDIDLFSDLSNELDIENKQHSKFQSIAFYLPVPQYIPQCIVLTHSGFNSYAPELTRYHILSPR